MDKNGYKIISLIRRASIKWAPRYEVINRNKLDRGKYRCEECDHIGPQKTLQVDHTSPVIPITGFDDWNGFVERLFCDASKLKLLCKECHKRKSTEENKLRAEHKKKLTDSKK